MIIDRIQNWYLNKFYPMTLTPKGECLNNYLLKLEEGSTDHIQPYDEIVEYVCKLMKEKHSMDFTFDETVNLLTAYFGEYCTES